MSRVTQSLKLEVLTKLDLEVTQKLDFIATRRDAYVRPQETKVSRGRDGINHV